MNCLFITILLVLLSSCNDVNSRKSEYERIDKEQKIKEKSLPDCVNKLELDELTRTGFAQTWNNAFISPKNNFFIPPDGIYRLINESFEQSISPKNTFMIMKLNKNTIELMAETKENNNTMVSRNNYNITWDKEHGIINLEATCKAVGTTFFKNGEYYYDMGGKSNPAFFNIYFPRVLEGKQDRYFLFYSYEAYNHHN